MAIGETKLFSIFFSKKMGNDGHKKKDIFKKKKWAQNGALEKSAHFQKMGAQKNKKNGQLPIFSVFFVFFVFCAHLPH